MRDTPTVAELARWREMFELIDGVLTWRADPSRRLRKRVILDGRKFTTARIAKFLSPRQIIPDCLDCPNYDDIKRMSAESGQTNETFLALSKQRDPFFLMPFRLAVAHWFADLWCRLAPSPIGVVERDFKALHFFSVRIQAKENRVD